MPEAADRRCEGIADFAARRALVAQVVLFTSGFTEEFIAQHQDDDRDGDLHELGEPQEAIYDGANTYVRVGGNWTGFFLGDPGGPRGVNDPLWPLDALFGARDAAEIGAESVRGVSAARLSAADRTWRGRYPRRLLGGRRVTACTRWAVSRRENQGPAEVGWTRTAWPAGSPDDRCHGGRRRHARRVGRRTVGLRGAGRHHAAGGQARSGRRRDAYCRGPPGRAGVPTSTQVPPCGENHGPFGKMMVRIAVWGRRASGTACRGRHGAYRRRWADERCWMS